MLRNRRRSNGRPVLNAVIFVLRPLLVQHAYQRSAVVINHHGFKHKLLLTNINTVSLRQMHTSILA